MEQVGADTADLAQVLEGQSLGGRVAVRRHQRQGEDGGIVLRRAATVADLDDPVHRADAVGLDAADQRLVVLLITHALRPAEGNRRIRGELGMNALYR